MPIIHNLYAHAHTRPAETKNYTIERPPTQKQPRVGTYFLAPGDQKKNIHLVEVRLKKLLVLIDRPQAHSGCEGFHSGWQGSVTHAAWHCYYIGHWFTHDSTIPRVLSLHNQHPRARTRLRTLPNCAWRGMNTTRYTRATARLRLSWGRGERPAYTLLPLCLGRGF